MHTPREILKDIQLLAMDVDGVLTQGDIIYSSNGEEIKIFNVKDGVGIDLLHKAGVKTAIISARTSDMVAKRAEELGIHYVYQGTKDKLKAVEKIIDDLNIDLIHVAYVGDDLPDLILLNQAGIAACPKDAVDEVKNACNIVTDLPGGKGAVREVIDIILSCKNI